MPKEIRRGPACALYALGTEDECGLLGFLRDLWTRDPGEFGRIMALLERTADHGPPQNKEKCRFFRGLRVFELKARDGVRIMAFWDKERLVVCSDGFIKRSRKTPKKEQDKARKARAAYFHAKGRGDVAFE